MTAWGAMTLVAGPCHPTEVLIGGGVEVGEIVSDQLQVVESYPVPGPFPSEPWRSGSWRATVNTTDSYTGADNPDWTVYAMCADP